MPTKRFVIPALVVTVGLTGAFLWYRRGSEPTPGSLSYDTQSAALTKGTDRNARDIYEQDYLGVNPDVSKEDLELSKNNGTPAQRAYGVALAEIMGQFSAATHESEPQLMFTALEKGDREKALIEIEKLKNLSEIYRRTAANLIALEVPVELASAHLAITNSVTRLETHVFNMSNILVDPLKAISSADEYVKESSALFVALATVNDFYTERDITFTEEERANVTLYEVQ